MKAIVVFYPFPSHPSVLIIADAKTSRDASVNFQSESSRYTTTPRYPSHTANMSLSIPNAPNAGLFKQGYQK